MIRKILFILLVFTNVSFSQFQEILSPKEIADKAMSDFSTGNHKNGFAFLEKYASGTEEERKEFFEDFNLAYQSQANLMDKKFGVSLGYEYVETISIGSSYKELRYMQKFSKYPVFWKFIFYKPKNDWLFDSMTFNSNIEKVFNN